MNNSITGKIAVINETQLVSDRFKKREFVLITDEDTKYPQFRKLEFVQDKCDILDQYQVGQTVDVEFNMNGRKWESPKGVQYFNCDQAWKISAVTQQATHGPGDEAPLPPAFPDDDPAIPF